LRQAMQVIYITEPVAHLGVRLVHRSIYGVIV